MAENYNRNSNQSDKVGNLENNPKNRESALYTALTRLFSGPLSNYKEQSQIRFKRRDLDRFKFTSASGQSFKKKSYNPFEAIQSNIMANQSRAERYSDFDQMEFMPEIASAMDIYADEMTTFNQFRPLLTIETKNEEIKQILHTLFYKTLNIKQNLFSWCRTMVKFGDFFMYLDIDEKIGIKGVLGLPSPEIERLEGEDETNPNYIQFQWNSAGMTFENWQIAHFRITGQDKYTPYGTSILEPARRIWRQLQLIEDAMMAYRIVRAPDRRVFYIDVGNVAPQDVQQYIQNIITSMKRNQIVDPTTGRVDLRYNPMSIDEDYYIPVRGTQSATKVDTLQGGAFVSAIEDVKYLRDKLFSALKVPQPYLTRGEGGADDKTTLAQKDIRFARTIQRLQEIIIAELTKIGMIHLYTLGFRNNDIINFNLRLHNPSKLSELQELEHFKSQLDIASAAKENGYSKRWIFENVFRMSDVEFVRNQRDLFYDAEFTKALEAVTAEGGEGMEGGAGTAGALGGDLGGGEMGAEMPPGETPEAGAEGGEAAGGEEESSLLAAPARREDEQWMKVKKPVAGTGKQPYVLPNSNRTAYKPVAASSNSIGARSRSTSSKIGVSTVSNTSRNTWAGKKGLDSIARGIANEEVNIYKKDEDLLLEMDLKLKSLSEQLSKKDSNGE